MLATGMSAAFPVIHASECSGRLVMCKRNASQFSENFQVLLCFNTGAQPVALDKKFEVLLVHQCMIRVCMACKCHSLPGKPQPWPSMQSERLKGLWSTNAMMLTTSAVDMFLSSSWTHHQQCMSAEHHSWRPCRMAVPERKVSS